MKLLNAKEIAGLLGISLRKLEQMISEGELPEYVKLGRIRRWDEAQIQKWLQDKFSKDGQKGENKKAVEL